MILFATLTASLVTNSGRSTWFVGAMAIMVYLIFATALYLCRRRETSERLTGIQHEPMKML